MSVAKIAISEIPAKRAERAAIVAAMPEFGSPNSRKTRHNMRRAAKRIEKQIYRQENKMTTHKRSLDQIVEDYYLNSPDWPINLATADIPTEVANFLLDDPDQFDRDEVLAAITRFVKEQAVV